MINKEMVAADSKLFAALLKTIDKAEIFLPLPDIGSLVEVSMFERRRLPPWGRQTVTAVTTSGVYMGIWRDPREIIIGSWQFVITSVGGLRGITVDSIECVRMVASLEASR